MLNSISLAVLMLIVATGQAYAYIDPGVGSILLQSLIAFIAAASVALSHYWHRIKSFFKSESGISEKSEGGISESVEKQTEDRS